MILNLFVSFQFHSCAMDVSDVGMYCVNSVSFGDVLVFCFWILRNISA